VNGEPTLDEKVVLLHQALEGAGIAHAFGGALALAYYAEPRATIDVDVNVFVPPRRAGRTLDALSALGVALDRRSTMELARRDGQARVRWGRTPLDLFFSYDPFHDACQATRRMVPFGDARIPILSPEHLVVCKAVFDRRKDWLDIEQVLFVTAPDLDVSEMVTWMERLLGPSDRRVKRLQGLVTEIVGD
jgi:hypothetical protein